MINFKDTPKGIYQLKFWKVAKKVIIIEDCNAINYLISTILKKDYSITSVKNSSDAMYQLQADVDRDLIILDISNFESDNYELLEHISTSCVLNDICRVVISDSNDSNLKIKTEALGASLFITKPFDPLYLSEKVKELTNINEISLSKKRKFAFNMNIF